MNRWMRNAVYPMVVALMLGVTGAAASATTASAASVRSGHAAASPRAAAAKERAARAVLKGLRLGAPLQRLGAARSFGPDSIATGTSANWSGYIDTNHASQGDFRNIAATWHVPEIVSGDCSHGTFATGAGLVSFWVGLDGSGSNTVEQAGTTSECYEGSAYYFDWYEMYPDGSVAVASVNPGDQISAYVDYTGKYYLLALIDNTQTAASFSELEACPSGSACDNYSAEAVAESPSGCVPGSGQTCRSQDGYSFFLMPDFNYVSFYAISDATYDYGGSLATGDFGPVNDTMTNSGNITLAKVTTLWNKDGFNDSWKASG
jgi:peptidase A4-like protein